MFRSGPAGRRPGLTRGPDVWEIARALRQMSAYVEEPVTVLAGEINLSTNQVETAVRYYEQYSDEIDAWIKEADDYSLHAKAAWRREQGLS